MGENFNDYVHRDPNPDEDGDQRVKYFIRLHTAPGSINPSVSFYDDNNEEWFPLEIGKYRASESDPVFLVGLNLKLDSLGYDIGPVRYIMIEHDWTVGADEIFYVDSVEAVRWDDDTPPTTFRWSASIPPPPWRRARHSMSASQWSTPSRSRTTSLST